MNAKTSVIKKMVKDPTTNKRLLRLFVDGKGWYSWNTVWHVYNSAANYDQLQESERKLINFKATARGK